MSLVDLKPALVIDVSPLWELQYTGISNVVLELTRRFVKVESQSFRTVFSVFHRIVPNEVIEQCVGSRNGGKLRELFAGPELEGAGEWAAKQCAMTAGLHLHVKPEKRMFYFESQLYYDLSFLSVPECHTPETIDYHSRGLQAQVDTTDKFFTISESTARDLEFYFAIDKSKIEVAYLGAHVDHYIEEAVRAQLSTLDAEGYFVCLGTIEPRKNIGLILAWLQRNTDVLRAFRFVFIGREGWGRSFQQLLEDHELVQFSADGRILHLGYATEQQKTALLVGSRGLLYPSLFEGFGLPVLEAMALGTPVASSCSTSLPEVLGPDGIYFDPYSIASFDEAMKTLIIESITGGGKERSLKLKRRSVEFSYDRCFQVISSALDTDHFSKLAT